MREEISNIVQSQRTYFRSGSTKEIGFRISVLKKLRAVLRENQESLNNAIYSDFKKSAFETYSTEFSLIFHELNLAIKRLRKWSRKRRVSTGLANLPGTSYILPEPLGTALVIGAWNYPYQLTLVPMISAVAAGNTVVVKPSELPARTSEIMTKLINDNFDARHLRVVEGGVPETTSLLNQKWDKIFFTGSTQVGKIVYRAAAEHLTPVTLELGGKSPTFVLKDANIQRTAQRIVWAKFLNAGQTCVAPDYVLVDKQIQEQLLKEIKIQLDKYHKHGTEFSDNYLQIINEKNFDRLVDLIEDEKVVFGGARDKKKRYIQPTIIHPADFSDRIMQEEIFGPILPVIPFDNLDQAVNVVQKREKPLACYVFTKNKKSTESILKKISFGGGCINDCVMHLSNSALPFGGVGNSGFGSYHGKHGFDTFSHYKSILKKPYWFEPNIKYAPYSDWKKKLIKLLLE